MAYQTCGYADPGVRSGSVHVANGDLLGAIDSLDGALAELAVRLDPVLSQCGPSDAAAKPIPNYSAPLAGDLQQKELRLRGMAECVRGLIARLEV